MGNEIIDIANNAIKQIDKAKMMFISSEKNIANATTKNLMDRSVLSILIQDQERTLIQLKDEMWKLEKEALTHANRNSY